MTKYLLTFAAVAIASAVAIAEVQSFDALIPAGKTLTATPSRKAASVPVEVRIDKAVPESGTLAVQAIHTLADGSPATNSVATVTITNGTTYAIASAPYVLRGDRLLLTFSDATNGCVTVVSDIKD